MAELKIISMDEVPVEEVEWLWYPYIPYGKLTIIHGDGGEGKTTLILRLAALLSREKNYPAMTPSGAYQGNISNRRGWAWGYYQAPSSCR